MDLIGLFVMGTGIIFLCLSLLYSGQEYNGVKATFYAILSVVVIISGGLIALAGVI